MSLLLWLLNFHLSKSKLNQNVFTENKIQIESEVTDRFYNRNDTDQNFLWILYFNYFFYVIRKSQIIM